MTRRIQATMAVMVMAGLCGLASASGASAAEWLLGGKLLTEAAIVESKDVGKINFTDMKGGLFNEEITVACETFGKGTVGPGAVAAEAKISTLNAKSETTCTTTKGTCAAKPGLTIIDLPWKFSLSSATSDTLERANEVTAPGYVLECALGVNSTCKAESAVALPVKNKKALEPNNIFADVNLEFTQTEAEAKPWDCSRGGQKQGLLKGKLEVFDPSGDLSVG